MVTIIIVKARCYPHRIYSSGSVSTPSAALPTSSEMDKRRIKWGWRRHKEIPFDATLEGSFDRNVSGPLPYVPPSMIREGPDWPEHVPLSSFMNTVVRIVDRECAKRNGRLGYVYRMEGVNYVWVQYVQQHPHEPGYVDCYRLQDLERVHPKSITAHDLYRILYRNFSSMRRLLRFLVGYHRHRSFHACKDLLDRLCELNMTRANYLMHMAPYMVDLNNYPSSLETSFRMPEHDLASGTTETTSAELTGGDLASDIPENISANEHATAGGTPETVATDAKLFSPFKGPDAPLGVRVRLPNERDISPDPLYWLELDHFRASSESDILFRCLHRTFWLDKSVRCMRDGTHPGKIRVSEWTDIAAEIPSERIKLYPGDVAPLGGIDLLSSSCKVVCLFKEQGYDHFLDIGEFVRMDEGHVYQIRFSQHLPWNLDARVTLPYGPFAHDEISPLTLTYHDILSLMHRDNKVLMSEIKKTVYDDEYYCLFQDHYDSTKLILTYLHRFGDPTQKTGKSWVPPPASSPSHCPDGDTPPTSSTTLPGDPHPKDFPASLSGITGSTYEIITEFETSPVFTPSWTET